MLGVRLYKNIQIDLWCGEVENFASDKSLPLTASVTQDEISNFLTSLSSQSHVSLLSENASDIPKNIFTTLKLTIDQSSQRSLPRRITVMTPLLEVYKVLQKQLFEIYPES